MKSRKRQIYEITHNTKAIITKETAYTRARILDKGRVRDVHYKPEEILEHNCLRHGVSLDGRRDSVRKILQIYNKLPVPVIPQLGVYLLPTASIKSKDCVWISYYHNDYFEQRDEKTYISFTDGTGLYVNTSATKFDMQRKRTSELIAHDHRITVFGNKNI